MKVAFREQQVEALWNRAEKSGMSRRKFLTLLAMGGATSVLAACAPAATQTSTVTTTATSPPTTTATRFVDQPTPPQFFRLIGGGNWEMLFQDLADKAYATPNSLFYIRDHTTTPQPPIDVTIWSLSVEGDGVASPFSLNYDDLLAMPSTTVTRYVECAGNGRAVKV